MGRPRLLFVHGSVANGDATWAAQRPLRDRFELVIPTRRGFPPNPEATSVDFEDEARWLDRLVTPGTHLVGHSYGAVIALFAAAWSRERVRSLTVIEPPAFGIVRDGRTDASIARSDELWDHGPHDPAAFLRAFMDVVGLPAPADPSPELLQGARLLRVERRPWRARPPLDAIVAPTLVVSGGHAQEFDAVCDVLEERLHAERAVLPGRGHAPQLLGEPFNALLAAFVERNEQLSAP